MNIEKKMKFKIKQTVDRIDLSDTKTPDDTYVEILFRSTGFSLYAFELSETFVKGGDKMMKVLGEYIGAVRKATKMLVALMKPYYNVLFKQIGFSKEEASDETFKQFSKRIEDYADLYYELYEIEHFMYMSKHSTLVADGN